jgi:hypothetical protein
MYGAPVIRVTPAEAGFTIVSAFVATPAPISSSTK